MYTSGTIQSCVLLTTKEVLGEVLLFNLSILEEWEIERCGLLKHVFKVFSRVYLNIWHFIFTFWMVG